MGEQIAAALHALLTDEERMPVLVLGTLWPEYDRQYTTLPIDGQQDLHSRVRELLTGRIAFGTLTWANAWSVASLGSASFTVVLRSIWCGSGASAVVEGIAPSTVKILVLVSAHAPAPSPACPGEAACQSLLLQHDHDR